MSNEKYLITPYSDRVVVFFFLDEAYILLFEK